MSEVLNVPLNALRAIHVVARTRALGPAAAELGVTPGAVSQHIKRAEQRLGVTLFERTAQGLVPTPELELVQPQLRKGFQALSDAVELLAARQSNVLSLSLGNVFMARWLVWRLPRFSAMAPELEMRFIATGKLVDPARPDVDCCIRYGKGVWPDTRAEPLGGRRFMPVCTPQLAEKLRSPADLARVPVIQDQSTMLSWADWLKGAGAEDVSVLKGPAYTDPALAFDAAEAGQGVLMAVDAMVADALVSGRLVRPFEHVQQSEQQYWFVTDANRHMPQHVRRFMDWIKAELAITHMA